MYGDRLQIKSYDKGTKFWVTWVQAKPSVQFIFHIIQCFSLFASLGYRV